MKRTVTFTSEDSLTFRMLFEGFCMGAAEGAQQPKRTPEVKRQERIVVKALNRISEPDVDAAGQPIKLSTGEKLRKLLPDGGTFELYQAELDLLIQYVESVNWLATSVVTAFDATDWLRAAPITKD